MLVLGRKAGERIRLTVGDVTVWVCIREVIRNHVRIAFDAPLSVVVEREEIIDWGKESARE